MEEFAPGRQALAFPSHPPDGRAPSLPNDLEVIPMQWLPFIIAYVGLGIFALAVIARILFWSRMPIHLRWELYPVAHEGKRARHGGSYLEEGEWWKKPRQVSLVGELKVMIPEILFLVALREHNPRLWVRSFPFHLGLYCIAACTLLMMLMGVAIEISPGILAGGLGSILDLLVPVAGAIGLVLALAGAAGLLQRRLTAPELREFSAKADYWNLALFLVVFGIVFANFLLIDRDFTRVRALVAGLVTFDAAKTTGSGVAGILPAVSMIAMSALVAYIPLTHMSHFVGKYFAYHAIRWNDAPNFPGGPQEKKIQGVLSQPVSWAAPHVKADGRKSWVDLATELPVEPKR
ncbi:MAG: respiratory nitrate reductase subunit gamma [Planctomycetota bacterium]